MNKQCNEFVNNITSISEGLMLEKQNCILYWLPDSPPLTTLFSSLGYRIAKDYISMSIDVKKYIFEEIEKAMNSGDDDLETAVATGLIEAIISEKLNNKEYSNRESWESMVRMFGKKTLHHANAWIGY